MLWCSIIILVLLGSSSSCWGSVAGQHQREQQQRRRRQNPPRLLRIPAASHHDDNNKDPTDLSSSSLLELELELDTTYFSSRELAQSLSMSMSPLTEAAAAAAAAAERGGGACFVPPPFAAEEMTIEIHVILEITEGEFFQELILGIEQQAAQALHGGVLQISVFDSQGNTTAMAEHIVASTQQETTEAKTTAPTVVGLITVGGTTAALCASLVTATEAAGIPVVSFDLEGGTGDDGTIACAGSTHQIRTRQSDTAIADMVLAQAAHDTTAEVVVGPDGMPGGPTPVGYVNDLHYEPLKIRNVVWDTYRKKYQWEQEFFVDQAATYTTAPALQDAIRAQLRAATTSTNTTIQFVYAPWDYLAINTVQVLKELNDDNDDDNSNDHDYTTTKVYGADINNADIEAMIAPQSPWLATAGGHPEMIGAALLRMNLVQLAQATTTTTTANANEFVQMPSFLFTQEFLLQEQVTNLDELLIAMPELRMQDIASACWIDPL